MSGRVTVNEGDTGIFVSPDESRWAKFKRRDHFEGRMSSWEVEYSDGRRMGGEWRWPALFNFLARWVMEKPRAD
jgi:hypothetical protein